MKRSNNIIIAALFAFCFSNSAISATITSTFDTNDEGWLISGDATSSFPTYVATGGNTGGFIEADDRASGGVWYFQAPGKFLGDVSSAYGQNLSFDLTQTGSGDQFNASDIILNGGGLQLTLDSISNPLPLGDWVSYSVVLDESGDWMNGAVAATEADILTVLGSLNRLRIRGEYISGFDTGGLDNVRLQAVPVPAAFWLFSSALLGLFTLRRR